MQKEPDLPSILPRVVVRLALVVAIQLVVVAMLVVASPRALTALAACLVATPARAIAGHIESNGAARAELAGALAAVLPVGAAPPGLGVVQTILVDRERGGTAALPAGPPPLPDTLAGPLRDWLEAGGADAAPAWCMLREGASLYSVGAAPRTGGDGWVVVLADETSSFTHWAVERTGALSFEVRPAADASPASLTPTLAGILAGSLPGNVSVPGLTGEPAIISFAVSSSSFAFLLRALGIIGGATVLLIAGVQTLTFASTYFQLMQPVKSIVDSLETYIRSGEWDPPRMRFRETQVAIDALTHALEEQKRAEAEALELAEQLRAFLDALPAAAAIKGADLRLRLVNSELARLAGKSPEELIGKTDLEVYPEDLARMYSYHDRQVIESGQALQFEEVVQTGDGERRTYRAFRAPVWDGDGQVSGLVSLAVDITREREMQARLVEAQKAQLMGRLAGGVAHIFNNVLTAVIGSAELALLSLTGDHPAREDLIQVKEAAERGARVSRQLLYLGRRQRTGDGPARAADAVAELLPVLREMGGPGIEIATEFGDDLPEVLLDAGELRQVVLHLALNAIEAMTDGGTVCIQGCEVAPPAEALMVEPSLRDRPIVRLRVQDSGPGISSGAIDHLFEPFYTTKGAAGGRGLGLAVVQSIVRNHQGAVLVHSEPGRGAAFDVYLPARLHERKGEDQSLSATDGAVPGREVILLAEDEPSVRELTQRMLASQGYTLLSAARGDEALGLVESRGEPPDLLLTDVLMPGMSGVELAVALRQRYPELPVLLMSGYVGESDDDDLRGFPLLWKPFTLESLTQKVRGLLDGQAH